jgi:hypothetical protein
VLLFNENSQNSTFEHEKYEYEGFKVLRQLLCDVAMLSDSFLHHKTYDVIKIYFKKFLKFVQLSQKVKKRDQLML